MPIVKGDLLLLLPPPLSCPDGRNYTAVGLRCRPGVVRRHQGHPIAIRSWLSCGVTGEERDEIFGHSARRTDESASWLRPDPGVGDRDDRGTPRRAHVEPGGSGAGRSWSMLISQR